MVLNYICVVTYKDILVRYHVRKVLAVADKKRKVIYETMDRMYFPTFINAIILFL